MNEIDNGSGNGKPSGPGHRGYVWGKFFIFHAAPLTPLRYRFNFNSTLVLLC
jgi:hypothetical protein